MNFSFHRISFDCHFLLYLLFIDFIIFSYNKSEPLNQYYL
ncbi:hypothetical protein CoNPh17_CDS0020 [Staphylococcus phage S-CoN_Ph17]|nr:hypothetical protein CoNPh17_CDS0020 [Staphylococcus phage S-CoN_Ph17]